MVTGIESFKEWFKGNESQYAIIGGTAKKSWRNSALICLT